MRAPHALADGVGFHLGLCDRGDLNIDHRKREDLEDCTDHHREECVLEKEIVLLGQARKEDHLEDEPHDEDEGGKTMIGTEHSYLLAQLSA